MDLLPVLLESFHGSTSSLLNRQHNPHLVQPFWQKFKILPTHIERQITVIKGEQLTQFLCKSVNHIIIISYTYYYAFITMLFFYYY